MSESVADRNKRFGTIRPQEFETIEVADGARYRSTT
jgi:hypothetical protein